MFREIFNPLGDFLDSVSQTNYVWGVIFWGDLKGIVSPLQRLLFKYFLFIIKGSFFESGLIIAILGVLFILSVVKLVRVLVSGGFFVVKMRVFLVNVGLFVKSLALGRILVVKKRIFWGNLKRALASRLGMALRVARKGWIQRDFLHR